MSGQTLRKAYMRHFSGMARYSRAVSWTIVAAYIGAILASIALGSYLLSLPVTIWTVASMVTTAIFIGTRLRGLNNIVHECTHATFASERQDNVMIGRLCAAVLLKSFRKYRDDHLTHHANNGDYESDADLKAIKKFGLHDPLNLRTVFRHIVTPLLGLHLTVYTGIDLSRDDGRFFVTFKLGLLAMMAALFLYAPFVAIFFVIVPMFYIFPTLNFWADCLDHAGLVGAEDELEASRNVLAPTPIRLLFFPRNDSYHLVHHLFPQIPAQHLHRAHAELCKDPSYRNVPSATRSADPSFEKSRLTEVR
jgi:fatty acid desaturase